MNYSRLIGVVGIALLLVVGLIATTQLRSVDKQHETVAACNSAMRTGNFTNCYETQTRLHTEFVCNQADTKCGAEVK